MTQLASLPGLCHQDAKVTGPADRGSRAPVKDQSLPCRRAHGRAGPRLAACCKIAMSAAMGFMLLQTI
jgi:hypothetical protein